MSERNVAKPGFFIWAGATGWFLLCYAVYAGIQAAERHSALLWVACAGLSVSALLSFTGALLEWRRRARSRTSDDGPERVRGRDDG